MTKNYVIYCRVSTTEQGESGLGLDAQLNTATAYINSQDGKILKTYSEVSSGRNNQRVELAKALTRCKLTGAELVIAKLDRLSRNAAFTMALAESGVEFIACDYPKACKLTIGIMASVAEDEAKRISLRTKAALDALKRSGKVLGNPNLHLYRNKDTSAATQKYSEMTKAYNLELLSALELFEEEHGMLSQAKIAALMNEAGYRTIRKGPLSDVTISRLRKMRKQA